MNKKNEYWLWRKSQCVHLECESHHSLEAPSSPCPQVRWCHSTLPSPKFHSVKLSFGLFLWTLSSSQRHITCFSLCMSPHTLNLRLRSNFCNFNHFPFFICSFYGFCSILQYEFPDDWGQRFPRELILQFKGKASLRGWHKCGLLRQLVAEQGLEGDKLHYSCSVYYQNLEV